MCTGALEREPDNLPLLMMRARARVALRRDRDAQIDLRAAVRIDRRNSMAYRLLGELAARRSENAQAAMYFREALRLDPADREAHDWLMIVDALLPAPPEPRGGRPDPGASRSGRLPVSEPARRPSVASEPRFARGTQPPAAPRPHEDPDAERPTRKFAREAARPDAGRRAEPFEAADDNRTTVRAVRSEQPTVPGRPGLSTREAPRFPPRQRTTVPELPGFDEYLVTHGILSRERLRAAQAYQRSMKVQLSTAIVTLGLATPQRIEWAAVAHRALLSEHGDDPTKRTRRE